MKALYVQHRLEDDCENDLLRFRGIPTSQGSEWDGRDRGLSRLRSSGKYITDVVSKNFASSSILQAYSSKNIKSGISSGFLQEESRMSGSSSVAAVQSCVCWSLAGPIVDAALKPIESYLR